MVKRTVNIPKQNQPESPCCKAIMKSRYIHNIAKLIIFCSACKKELTTEEIRLHNEKHGN
jgi:hypothetical protein